MFKASGFCLWLLDSFLLLLLLLLNLFFLPAVFLLSLSLFVIFYFISISLSFVSFYFILQCWCFLFFFCFWLCVVRAPRVLQCIGLGEHFERILVLARRKRASYYYCWAGVFLPTVYVCGTFKSVVFFCVSSRCVACITPHRLSPTTDRRKSQQRRRLRAPPLLLQSTPQSLTQRNSKYCLASVPQLHLRQFQ